MAETGAKYHHLVPQVHMSAWAQGKGTLNVEFIDKRGVIEQRKYRRIDQLSFHKGR